MHILSPETDNCPSWNFKCFSVSDIAPDKRVASIHFSYFFLKHYVNWYLFEAYVYWYSYEAEVLIKVLRMSIHNICFCTKKNLTLVHISYLSVSISMQFKYLALMKNISSSIIKVHLKLKIQFLVKHYLQGLFYHYLNYSYSTFTLRELALLDGPLRSNFVSVGSFNFHILYLHS